MPLSATLELHFINVGQGDSILIVNRDRDQLQAVVQSAPANVIDNPIHHLPYAIDMGLDLHGTVRKAVLIDAGDDQYGDNVVAYLEDHGVLDKEKPGYAPNLEVVISHFHDDHMAGLLSLFTQWTYGMKDGKPSRKLTERYWPKRVYLTEENKKEDPKRSARLEAVRTCITKAVTKSPGTIAIYVQPGGVVAHNAKMDDPAPAGLAPGGGSPDNNEIEVEEQSNSISVEGPSDSAGSEIQEEKQLSPQDDSASGVSGFEPPKQLIIPLGEGIDGIPITLTAYAASRAVYCEDNEAKCKEVPSATRDPDQNDRSIMFVLQYGSFRAYLGGDLAGNGGQGGGNTGDNAADTGTKSFFSMHTNVEKDLNAALVRYLPSTVTAMPHEPKFTVPGYCTVLKANHHASSSSVDVHTLATTQPCIAFVPAGVKARFHSHPTQQVLDRMSGTKTKFWEYPKTVPPTADVANTLKCIYLSEVAKKYKDKKYGVILPPEAKIAGDVVVRPVDETVAAIQSAAALGEKTLTVQVYATGGQTEMDEVVNENDRVELCPLSCALGSTPPYPIGPFEHTCNLH